MEQEKPKQEYKRQTILQDERSLVRILATDIPGEKRVIAGLTRIKGISWSFAGAICHKLKIDKKRKMLDLSKEEVEKISNFILHPEVPEFLLNRRNDRDTGKNIHLIGTDLDLRREFDIKRMRKIKSYKGIRHLTGQPVRGQRTKSHFRKNKTVGVQKRKAAPAKAK